jgi:hypothetical protein
MVRSSSYVLNAAQASSSYVLNAAQALKEINTEITVILGMISITRAESWGL